MNTSRPSLMNALRHQLVIQRCYSRVLSLKSHRIRIEPSKKESQATSFRRKAQTLKPIQPIHSDSYPISKETEKRLKLFLQHSIAA